MERVIQLMMEQNERVISALEGIAERLDVLQELKATLDSIGFDFSTKEIVPESLFDDVTDMKSIVERIHGELKWHKEESFASELIRAVEKSG